MSHKVDIMPTAASVSYSTSDIAHLVGASYRMLNWWCSQGLLAETASGSGSRRRFTELDLRVAAAITQLTRLGCSGAPLRSICSMLYEKLPTCTSPSYLIAQQDGRARLVSTFVLTEEPAWIVPINTSEQTVSAAA